MHIKDPYTCFDNKGPLIYIMYVFYVVHLLVVMKIVTRCTVYIFFFFFFHGVTARSGPEPPSFWDFIPKVHSVVSDRITARTFLLDPDETARAIWQTVRRLG
jgi:hypothetical protein